MITLRRVVWIATAGYWLLLFTATHVPAWGLPPVPVKDKTAHFVGYGLLATGLFLSLYLARPARTDVPIFVLMICLVYGAIDEWSQIPVGRSCELADWHADAAGAAVAVVAGWLILRWKSRPKIGEP